MDETKRGPEENVSHLDTTAPVTETREAPKEKFYTQAEVDEIVRQRLESAQASPELTPEEQRAAELDARELNMQKREYLLEQVQRWGLKNISTQVHGMKELFGDRNSPYDYFKESAKKLCGIWEADEMDSFAKSVDAMFDMLAQARSQGYDTGMEAGVEKAATTHNVKKESDVMKEIFKNGGHF